MVLLCIYEKCEFVTLSTTVSHFPLQLKLHLVNVRMTHFCFYFGLPSLPQLDQNQYKRLSFLLPRNPDHFTTKICIWPLPCMRSTIISPNKPNNPRLHDNPSKVISIFVTHPKATNTLLILSNLVHKWDMVPLLRVYVKNGQKFVVTDSEVSLHVGEPGVESDKVSHLVVQN